MLKFKTPQDIVDAYINGLDGAQCDLEDTDRLLQSLPMPLFGDYMDMIAGSGKGKLVTPYKAMYKYEPEFGTYERQTTGDCVSHAFRNAVDISRACEIEFGEAESFVERGATEGIYGSRGHTGEGMSCSQAARFISQQAGLLIRKPYGNVDLSVYNARLGTNWGRGGVPRTLMEAGQQNQVKTVSLIRTVEEARDALANGYAIAVCSNYGFDSRRDKNGIARKKGTWYHGMAWGGVDDTGERDRSCLFCVINSWGMWNGGPRVHEQPHGSFWITERDAAGMLSQNGAFVVSNVEGFPPKKIDFSGWDSV